MEKQETILKVANIYIYKTICTTDCHSSKERSKYSCYEKNTPLCDDAEHIITDDKLFGDRKYF